MMNQMNREWMNQTNHERIINDKWSCINCEESCYEWISDEYWLNKSQMNHEWINHTIIHSFVIHHESNETWFNKWMNQFEWLMDESCMIYEQTNHEWMVHEW